MVRDLPASRQSYSVTCFPPSIWYGRCLCDSLIRGGRFMALTCRSFFFFNDTPTTEIYTFPYTTLFRSPRASAAASAASAERTARDPRAGAPHRRPRDRKSTRLNSSHVEISYAVFCL